MVRIRVISCFVKRSYTTMNRRIALSRFSIESEKDGGSRIKLSDRDLTVWPEDCRYLSTSYLAQKNPIPRDGDIVLDEATHIYTIKGDNAPFSSTGFVHSPFSHFDPRQVIPNMNKERRLAQHANRTDRQIARYWGKLGEEASSMGTRVHAAVEVALNTGYWSKDHRIQTEMKHAKAFFDKEIKGKGLEVFRTEPMIYLELPDTSAPNGVFRLPGSVDCVFYDPERKEYGLFDWKRSKGIKLSASGRNGYGIPPFDQMEDVNYSHYSLQLCLYAYILKTQYGLNVNPRRLYIVVFHPNFETYQMYQAADVYHLIQDELIPNRDKYTKIMMHNKAHEKEIEKWKSKPEVFNIKSPSSYYHEDCVYIGRGQNSIWGNPFKIGDPDPDPNRKEKMSRERVIELYRDWILSTPSLAKQIPKQLRNKSLLCYCEPDDCHGDVLSELAELGNPEMEELLSKI